VLVLSSSSSQHDFMGKGIVMLVLSFLTVEKMIHVPTCIHHLLEIMILLSRANPRRVAI
jgi:hypothetical protein